MDWHTLASSNMSRVRWDPGTSVMEIEFQNGRVYQYFDVPEAVFTGLRTAGSAGTYFNENIKGAFRYARV